MRSWTAIRRSASDRFAAKRPRRENPASRAILCHARTAVDVARLQSRMRLFEPDRFQISYRRQPILPQLRRRTSSRSAGRPVQVRSPDEANEPDLAANEPSATTAPASDPSVSGGSGPLYNLAPTVPPTDSDAAPSASGASPAIAAPARSPPQPIRRNPKAQSGRAFWFMQIMAALGGAAAAGSAAWFLIGSASPWISVSQWQKADDEA